MSAEKRRKMIIGLLKTAGVPVSGTALAQQCQVSRQINCTGYFPCCGPPGTRFCPHSKGYLLQGTPAFTCIFQVQHSDVQIADELNSIVDLGGTVLDVSVHHDLYGDLKAPLYAASRQQVQEFVQSLQERRANPLKNLTADVHCHTVEAASEQILNQIEDMLKQKGYFLQSVFIK